MLTGQLQLDFGALAAPAPVSRPTRRPGGEALDLADHAAQNGYSGPRTVAPHAHSRERLDDPMSALGPARCQCDRPARIYDGEARETRCLKCGRA